jgi:putative ABC transport system permease protein
VGSSLIPIIRINKVPLRDIILNTYARQDDIKTGRTRIALVILVLSLVVPRLVPEKAAGVLGSLSIITATVAVVWLIPHIMDSSSCFISGLFPVFSAMKGSWP